LEASWGYLGRQKTEKRNLAWQWEREARFYPHAVSVYEYLLCFSALANCKILAG